MSSECEALIRLFDRIDRLIWIPFKLPCKPDVDRALLASTSGFIRFAFVPWKAGRDVNVSRTESRTFTRIPVDGRIASKRVVRLSGCLTRQRSLVTAYLLESRCIRFPKSIKYHLLDEREILEFPSSTHRKVPRMFRTASRDPLR